MTNLLAVKVHQLRNLVDVDIEPGPRFNILYGDNGSGKTSFLEAIHYLGLGRSFRTRQHARVINHDTNECIIFAQVTQMGSNTTIPIGLQKVKQGNSQLKVSGSPSTLNTVADLLPIQLIHPDGHKLIASGPKYRRQYLDWGVFHVEQSFFSYWQRAQRALKHRNALLKHQGIRYSELEVWDRELCNVSVAIHEARKRYIENLNPVVADIIQQMQLAFCVDISYQAGWDTQATLSDILQTDFRRDIRLGFTQHGAHKADLTLKVENKPAHDVLSQGQQKMLIYALTLAQSRLLTQLTKKSSIFLIDDLPAELDAHKRLKLTQLLSSDANQVFITGIERESLLPFIEMENSRVFHVEHGTITPEETHITAV